MNCREVQENLSAYLDKALTPDEMIKITAHLEQCAHCQKELKALEDTIFMLASLEEVVPPARFRHELRQKLEKLAPEPHQAPSQRKMNIWYHKFRKTGLMPVVAAAVLMLVLLPFMSDNVGYKKSKSAAPESAARDEYRNTQNVGFGGSPEMPKMKVSAPAAPAPREDMKIMADAQTNFSSQDMELKGEVGTRQEATFIERKLIKNAELQLQVEDYKAAVASLKEQVIALGGYIANETLNVTGSGQTLSGHLQVRVPQEKFEFFVDGMDGVGKVMGRNIYAQDVTEEYVDVESRLKALRTKEERLLAILQKSGQLGDVLAVENELANTRSQLEAFEGRLRYLNNRTEFANISIGIQQIVVPTQQISTVGLTGVLDRTYEAFIKTVNNILLYIGKLIVYLGAALPYLLLALLAGVFVWYWYKKRKA